MSGRLAAAAAFLVTVSFEWRVRTGWSLGDGRGPGLAVSSGLARAVPFGGLAERVQTAAAAEQDGSALILQPQGTVAGHKHAADGIGLLNRLARLCALGHAGSIFPEK